MTATRPTLPGIVLVEPGERNTLFVQTRPLERLSIAPRTFRERTAALAYAGDLAQRHGLLLVDLAAAQAE